MRVRLILVENERIKDLGEYIGNELLPSVGDKLYFKDATQQYNVTERHFNVMAGLPFDAELVVEKTKLYSE